jgi:hypothetical protein
MGEGMIEVIDRRYLPFSAEQLGQHFQSDGRDRHVEYYQKSAQRYHQFLQSHPNRAGVPLREAAFACQIEKDERFWTATALMSLYNSPARTDHFIALLSSAFGDRPPLRDFASWEGCLTGDLRLILECVLPSPPSYLAWLRDHWEQRQFVPYVLKAADRARPTPLEGPTHVDALLINKDNGFAVLIEAKALSDVSVPSLKWLYNERP